MLSPDIGNALQQIDLAAIQSMKDISIRPFEGKDAKAAARLFFASVHHGTRAHYNEAQRYAWAPKIPNTSLWRDRLGSQCTFVAEENETLVGFMTVTAGGYIDLAFVAPDAIGKGVAKRLYDAVEAEALRLGTQRLHCEASHLARPFFERQGWSVVREQTVSPNGVSMINFVMEKQLP